jgi:hypothetical protein
MSSSKTQPWVQDDEDDEDASGLSWQVASDCPVRAIQASRGLDTTTAHSEIMGAIRAEYPTSDPAYHALIFRRFVVMYAGIPKADALHAIMSGYTSPSAAMRARVIRKRRYVGDNGKAAS